MGDLDKALKDLIESNGEPVRVGTVFCKEFKKEKNNCIGCAAELGCSKFVGIQLLALQGALCKVQDFEQMRKNLAAENKIVQEVLRAKTVDDVMALIRGY